MRRALGESVAQMRALPSILFLLLALKALESFADFVMALNLGLYASDMLGYNDEEVGVVYGVWGVTTSVAGMMLGSTIDRLGTRRALLVGSACALAGRTLLAVTRVRGLACFALFGLMSVGEAFAIPVLSIAIRHVVPQASLELAFSLFYMAMQLGAVAAGLLTDGVRAHGGTNALGIVMCLPPMTTAVYAFAVYRFYPSMRTHADVKPTHLEVRRTCLDPVFWRLVAFTLLLAGTSMVQRQIDITMPKFVLRTLGSDAAYGELYAINPAIVFFTVTLAQTVTSRYDAYSSIVTGTLITALAPLCIYLVADVSYASLVAFLVLFSLGEVIWSPRVYSYCLTLAPRGHEGVYSALASAPQFLIRLASGASSGFLLQRYCPELPPRAATLATTPSFIPHCQTLWFIVAGIAVTTPLGLLYWKSTLYPDAIRELANGGRLPLHRTTTTTTTPD
jgi:dipeptide/tripeptide permease